MNAFSSRLHYCTQLFNLIYCVIWRASSLLVRFCILHVSAAFFKINSLLI